MTKSNPLSALDQIHYRIIPQKITCHQLKPQSSAQYMVQLEKGMQIIGKSTIVKMSRGKRIAKFPLSRNFVDFQIVNRKNTNFRWSFYKIEEDKSETRIIEKQFSIKQFQEKYRTSSKNHNFIKTLQFTQKFSFTFRVLLQSTADLIMDLTAAILPETLNKQQEQSSLSEELSVPVQESENEDQIQAEKMQKMDLLMKKQKNSLNDTRSENVDMAKKAESEMKIPEKHIKSSHSLIQKQKQEKQANRGNETIKQEFQKSSSENSLSQLKPFSKYESLSIIEEDANFNAFKNAPQSQKPPFSTSPNEIEAQISVTPVREDKNDQKIKKIKKYAIILMIIVLMIGFLGKALFTHKQSQRKNAKKKRKRKQVY